MFPAPTTIASSVPASCTARTSRAIASTVDGLTCLVQRPRRKSKVPVIVVNQNVTLERRRLTLAHELAHRPIDDRSPVDHEKASTIFAGAFLAVVLLAGAFFAVVFVAVAFFAGAFLAGAFFAGAFFAVAALEVVAFFVAARFAGALLAAVFLAGAFLAAAFAGAFFAVVFVAVAFLAGAFFAGAFFALDAVEAAVFLSATATSSGAG